MLVSREWAAERADRGGETRAVGRPEKSGCVCAKEMPCKCTRGHLWGADRRSPLGAERFSSAALWPWLRVRPSLIRVAFRCVCVGRSGSVQPPFSRTRRSGIVAPIEERRAFPRQQPRRPTSPDLPGGGLSAASKRLPRASLCSSSASLAPASSGCAESCSPLEFKRGHRRAAPSGLFVCKDSSQYRVAPSVLRNCSSCACY